MFIELLWSLWELEWFCSMISCGPIPVLHDMRRDVSDSSTRVAQPYWARVRGLLEEWFAHLPDDDERDRSIRQDLRKGFRSADDRQFQAAFWELYLHEMLTRAGYKLTLRPTVRDLTPDFLAEGRDGSFYIEATVASDMTDTERARDRRRGRVYDALNELKSDQFWLYVTIEKESAQSPPTRSLKRQVASWLKTLNPSDAVFSPKGFEQLPCLPWEGDGWEIEIRAFRRNKARRWDCTPTVAAESIDDVEWVNDRERIYKALRQKARRYRDVVDRPLLIAILVETISAEEIDVEQALYGSEAVEVPTGNLVRLPDGAWRDRQGFQRRGCSAVMVAFNLAPWMVTTARPGVWHHPEPAHPLELKLPWPQIRLVGHDRLGMVDAGPEDLSQFLDLPPEWPGPEERFQRN